jgi:dTDP-4-amino-4,6-dideoxygalactose transaminase
MEKPKIKFELEISHGSIYGPEEEAALLEVLRASAPSCGKKVKQFEQAFAAYCGVRYALSCTSATTGLTLAGIAAGVGAGSEVITTPISWIATASAFSVLGARLVFCDVDPRTLNLDPDRLEALISPRTKAIVPVHLAGQCAAMDRIMAIARKHGVAVIEDCAHTPGAEYLGRKAGALGDLGVFSFHQQKNMCTLGEGGLVTTDSRELYEKVLSYRSLCCRVYGGSDKYLPIDEAKYPMGQEYWRLQFDDLGYNFRMIDAQAAVGSEQLKKLDGFNARRINWPRAPDRKAAVRPGSCCLGWTEGQARVPLLRPAARRRTPAEERTSYGSCTYKGIKAWNHYTPIHWQSLPGAGAGKGSVRGRRRPTSASCPCRSTPGSPRRPSTTWPTA